MADYLCTSNPAQRTAVIREARFPRVIQASAYTRARPVMMKVMQGGKSAMPSALMSITRLEAEAKSADGLEKMELNRCATAIGSFLDLYTSSKMHRFMIAKPEGFRLVKSGLTISVATHGIVQETKGDSTYGGGCIIFTAGSDAARQNIEGRLKITAGLLLWALEESGQMEPLPRLCFAIDVLGAQVIRASPSFERLRAHVEQASEEIVARWRGVKPPNGYDGPTPS